MTEAGSRGADLSALAAEPYDGERLVAAIRAVVADWRYSQINHPSRLPHHTYLLTGVLDASRAAR